VGLYGLGATAVLLNKFVLNDELFGWMAAGELAFWISFFSIASALVLAGTLPSNAGGQRATVLVCVGAVAGALLLVWTLIVPVVALALAALAITNIRRANRPGTP
jgi:hypothetical protein